MSFLPTKSSVKPKRTSAVLLGSVILLVGVTALLSYKILYHVILNNLKANMHLKVETTGNEIDNLLASKLEKLKLLVRYPDG